MTAPRKVALTEDEIKAAAKKYAVGWLPSNTVGGTFEAGARFARSFYEHREALWQELTALLTMPWALRETEDNERIAELRAALGLEG